MAVTVALEDAQLEVEPGEQVSTTVRVRNTTAPDTSRQVDEFTISVVGDGADWATVDPPVLRLFPDEQGEATLTFAPPRAPSTPAGDLVYGVKVTSRERPDSSYVEEGGLTVGEFVEVVTALTPQTSQGRLSARHELTVENRGNVPDVSQVGASDPDAALDFAFDEPEVPVDPGGTATVDLKVKPGERMWRGAPRPRPFQVAVRPAAAAPLTVDGRLLQQPIIPDWLPKALMWLLGAAIAAAILWFALLRPQVESAATDAVAAPMAEQSARLDNVEDEVRDLGGEIEEVEVDDDDDDGSSVVPRRRPFDERVGVAPDPGGDPGTGSIRVPSGSSLAVTDLVLQNPTGAIGQVTVARDGRRLLVLRLENFRDIDYHFVTPVMVDGGESLTLRVDCDEQSDRTCSVGMYVVGELVSDG